MRRTPARPRLPPSTRRSSIPSRPTRHLVCPGTRWTRVAPRAAAPVRAPPPSRHPAPRCSRWARIPCRRGPRLRQTPSRRGRSRTHDRPVRSWSTSTGFPARTAVARWLHFLPSRIWKQSPVPQPTPQGGAVIPSPRALERSRQASSAARSEQLRRGQDEDRERDDGENEESVDDRASAAAARLGNRMRRWEGPGLISGPCC